MYQAKAISSVFCGFVCKQVKCLAKAFAVLKLITDGSNISA